MNPEFPWQGLLTRTSVSLPSSESCPGIQLKIEDNILRAGIFQKRYCRVLALCKIRTKARIKQKKTSDVANKPQGIPMKEALYDLKPHTKLKLRGKCPTCSEINNINDRIAQ